VENEPRCAECKKKYQHRYGNRTDLPAAEPLEIAFARGKRNRVLVRDGERQPACGNHHRQCRDEWLNASFRDQQAVDEADDCGGRDAGQDSRHSSESREIHRRDSRHRKHRSD